MNLIDQKVTHNHFGQGIITAISDKSIEVRFEQDMKKFMYPESFVKFLTLENDAVALQMEPILSEMLQQKQQIADDKERLLQQARKKQQQIIEYERLMSNHKLHPQSQIVFWCDEEEKEQVFAQGELFAGAIKSGSNKGKPVKLARLHSNSAVVLTNKEKGMLEEERKITGIFMVTKNYIGKMVDTGMIEVHETFKISLTDEEAQQLPLWKYYTNTKSPKKISWESGKFKYCENEWIAQMLVDIVTIKTDEEERKLAQRFLLYFCKLNKLFIEDLVEPNGLLIASTN